MFLLKFFYFLKGYDIIGIKGKRNAFFINKMASEKLKIWNIKPDEFCAWQKDKDKIDKIANDCQKEIYIIKKYSLKEKLLKDNLWFLVVCFSLFITCVLISSSYVWKIRVEGANENLTKEILLSAEKAGLKQGVKKNSFKDKNALKDAILYNTDGINWVWVYFEGTCAVIKVSEDIPAPLIEEDLNSCNISAKTDAILKYVSAKTGEKIKGAGEKVKAGDVVISGVIPTANQGEPYTICAKGEVLAETSYIKSCEYSVNKVYTKDTGHEKTAYSIRLFELEIPLNPFLKIDFDEYRIVESTPPVGICKRRYIETTTQKEQIPIESAVWEAKEALYEIIAKKISPGAKRIFEDVKYSHISEDKIKVTLCMNFIEDIGIKTPIEKWQTEELTDDKTN